MKTMRAFEVMSINLSNVVRICT